MSEENSNGGGIKTDFDGQTDAELRDDFGHAKTLGFMRKILALFIRPSLLFYDIKSRNDFILPGIVLFVLGLPLIFMLGYQFEAISGSFEDTASEEIADFPISSVYYFVALFSLPLSIAADWIVFAAIVFLIASALSHRLDFLKLVSVAGFALIPQYLGSIAFVAIMTYQMTPHTEIGLELGEKSKSAFTFSLDQLITADGSAKGFLKAFDLFQLWKIYLLAIGLRVTFNLLARRAVAVAAIYFALMAIYYYFHSVTMDVFSGLTSSDRLPTYIGE